MIHPLAGISFEGSAIRTVLKDGEPWFVATDVCRVLGIKHTPDAISRLEPDDVVTSDTIDAMGRTQEKVNFVSESGLYQLVFQSRKPEAKAFTRWITKEVLPSIRKNGYYSVHKSPEGRFLALLDALIDRKLLPLRALFVAKRISRVSPDEATDEACLALADEIFARTNDKSSARTFARHFDREVQALLREAENERLKISDS